MCIRDRRRADHRRGRVADGRAGSRPGRPRGGARRLRAAARAVARREAASDRLSETTAAQLRADRAQEPTARGRRAAADCRD